MKTQILIAAAVASTAGAFSVSVSKDLHMIWYEEEDVYDMHIFWYNSEGHLFIAW